MPARPEALEAPAVATKEPLGRAVELGDDGVFVSRVEREGACAPFEDLGAKRRHVGAQRLAGLHVEAEHEGLLPFSPQRRGAVDHRPDLRVGAPAVGGVVGELGADPIEVPAQPWGVNEAAGGVVSGVVVEDGRAVPACVCVRLERRREPIGEVRPGRRRTVGPGEGRQRLRERRAGTAGLLNRRP